MIIRIKRQKDYHSEPYYQEFEYTPLGDETILLVIERLNYQSGLKDINGNRAERIRCDYSCKQKMCGGCAMVINGKPSLACKTFLRDLKGEIITIEPLSKFPVIQDLAVDRSIIYENLVRANLLLDKKLKHDEKDFQLQYTISKCMKCGLCLEVCPNYKKGDNFFGPILANESYLVDSLSENTNKDNLKAYKEHFFIGCSLAKSCAFICPMNIPTITSIAKMNRLTNKIKK